MFKVNIDTIQTILDRLCDQVLLQLLSRCGASEHLADLAVITEIIAYAPHLYTKASGSRHIRITGK